MKNLMTLFTIGMLLVSACGSDEDSLPAVKGVSDLVIDDITNQGNGTDLEVSFTGLDEEAGLDTYRFFLVKTNKADNFSRIKAEAIEADFVDIGKGKAVQTVVLSANSTDTDGDQITEGISYTGFILSIGVEGVSNVMSDPSNAIVLKQSTIKITYIGNDGVHISDGSQAVIIDALPGDLSGWSPIASGVQTDIEQGSGKFSNIRVAMVTHAHGDHVSSTSVNRFLAGHANATAILPAEMHGSITSTAQLSDMTPIRGQSATATFNGIKITVMHMRHFDLFGNDFSGVDNYGYLIEMGGKKIVHLGDVFFSEDNFAPFDLTAEEIDVLIIPTFDALVSTDNKAIVDAQIAPGHIIGLHLPTATTKDFVTNVYSDARVFKTSLEFERY